MAASTQELEMAGMSEATMDRLRSLAQSVALVRKHGGVLDDLPEEQQGAVQALGEAQRQFFLDELAKAEAEVGRDRFHAMLGQWSARQAGTCPDPGDRR
jgi:hypothetical protein